MPDPAAARTLVFLLYRSSLSYDQDRLHESTDE